MSTRNFSKLYVENPDQQKTWWVTTHDHRQNRAFACIGARLTLKMGRCGCDGQPAAQQRSKQTSSRNSVRCEIGILDHLKWWWAIEHDHQQNRVCATGLVWPLNWVAREGIPMTRDGLTNVNKKYWQFGRRRSGSLTKMMSYSRWS